MTSSLAATPGSKHKLKALRRALLSLLAASLMTGCGEMLGMLLPDLGPNGQSQVGQNQAGQTEVRLRQIANQAGIEDLARDLRIVSAEYEASLATSQRRLIVQTDPADAAVSLLDYGQVVSFEAIVEGLEDTRVHWKLELAEDGSTWEPGQLSVNGTRATYTAPSAYSRVRLTVTSQADPSLERVYLLVTNGGTECVTGQTPVTLVDGRRLPIAQIQAGDRIKAWNESRRRVITAEVEAQLVHTGKYALHLIKGADGDELRVTGNHPVYTREAGWLPVDQLRPGMTLMQFDHSSRRFVPTQLLSIIREESSAERVYNLRTSAGNYFAADILVHNKCFAAGSLIETADGPRPIELIRPGDQLWDIEAGQRVLTRVRKLYAKRTVLENLPGKRLSERIAITLNHRLYWQGRWRSAAETNLPEVAISGPVYDLLTESGSYLAGGVLMGGLPIASGLSPAPGLGLAAS